MEARYTRCPVFQECRNVEFLTVPPCDAIRLHCIWPSYFYHWFPELVKIIHFFVQLNKFPVTATNADLIHQELAIL
jgi:hypothetical protein